MITVDLNALPRRQRLAMLMILQAADQGAPCPSNAEIADQLDMARKADVVDVIRTLERRGLITVERFSKSRRRVTIVGTGKQTAHTGGEKPHWRLRPVAEEVAAEARAAGIRRAVAGMNANVSNPLPLNDRPQVAAPRGGEIVDRDPCPRCGVRRDIGCRHTARTLRVGYAGQAGRA